MATRFPNGIETSDLKITGEVTHSSTEALEVASLTTTGNGVIGGTLAVAGGITAGSVTAPVINTAVSVDCTNDVTLSAAQKAASIINISAAGTSKVLILGMDAGRIITITNAGVNNVTVKNVTANTGVVATAAKTAMFLTGAAAAEPIKLTADV